MLVEYEGGMRFRATTDGYTVTSGEGADGDASRDNMSPGQLFVASLAMCFAAYVVGYCRNHDIPCDDLAIEIVRETARAPSRTTRVAARIRLGADLSDQQKRAILQVANHCHVHNSIKHGMDIELTLAGASAGESSAVTT